MSRRLAVVLCVLAMGGLVAASRVMAQEAKPDVLTGAKAAVTAVATRAAATTQAEGLHPLAEKGKPFAIIPKAKKAPNLDGKIDPEVWGAKPTLTGFYDQDTGKPVPKNIQPQVWLLYDAEKLYIAAKMLEPQMNELMAETSEHDGNVWNDDDLEIFLDPGKTKDPAKYYQIVVNAIGTVADQKGAPDAGGDTAWDCKDCSVKTAKGADFWVVQMAIPFKALGVTKPVAGTRWGANFCHDRKAGAAEKSSWANLGPEWHQPDQFGTIVFEP